MSEPAKFVTVKLELKPHHAAALARLCDKFDHHDAARYLYPHVPTAVRQEQCYHMCQVTFLVFKALAEAEVSSWPWIETGSP